MVSRRRLLDLLSRSSESVVLIVAPPAFGKSTLIGEYVREEDPDARAMTLAAGDLESFVRELVAIVDPRAARGVGALFDGAGAPGFVDTLRLWLMARLRRFGGAIAIDDLHRASEDPRVFTLLEGLVDATYERNRWVLASREMPKLPIASWIAHGRMALPITDDELAFRPDEVAALADELGVGIDDDGIAALVADTGGWALGIRLSLDLWGRRAERRPIRERTRAVLFEYIDTELWARLSEAQRELLFACSVVPSPSISVLLAAGYEDAAGLIDELCRLVPFVRRDGADAVGLHDLFRDYLGDRLAQVPGRAEALGVRLGSALQRARRRGDALQIFLGAGCVEQVHALLAVEAFELIETGHRPTVTRAVAHLAENGYADDAVVAAVRAAAALADGSSDNAAALYTRALDLGLPSSMRGQVARRLALLYFSLGKAAEGLAALGPLIADDALPENERAEIASICAAGYALAGRSREAERFTDEVRQRLRGAAPETRARVLQRLGAAEFYRGNLLAAEDHSRDAAALARDLGLDVTAAWSYLTLYGVARAVDGDLTRALTFARLQTQSAERGGLIALRVNGLRNELGLLVEMGDFDGARLVEAGLTLLPDTRTVRDSLTVRLPRAILALRAGNANRAHTILTSAADAGLGPAERAFRDAFAAVFGLLDGKRAAAEELTKRGLLSEAVDDFASRRSFAQAHALRGLLLWSLDRPAQARRAFSFDFTFLGERDRVLIEVLRDVAALPHPLPNPEAIEDAVGRLARFHRHDYATVLRAVARRDAAYVELTPAEIEILRAFDRHGGSTGDVAAALGKSRYTVQNQVQAAIKKIGCSGRGEALAYARRRGWLA